jgi:hypothetical protein
MRIRTLETPGAFRSYVSSDQLQCRPRSYDLVGVVGFIGKNDARPAAQEEEVIE